MMPDGEVIDLGNGHRGELTHYNGELTGMLHFHPRPDNGEECWGAIFFPSNPISHRPNWQVLSSDPLTITPSLLCRTCGSHGFVRNGQWEQA